MFDRHLRPLIDPPLNMIGGQLARTGLTANAVTLIGLAFGLAGAGAIVLGQFYLAIALILASRVADGLDGAVARAHGVTDFGGYLDITSDFVFYAAIPLAFVLYDPASNGVAGAVLLASFYINGASFLGYAILAEKKQMRSDSHGVKSLYFTGGLLEGAETIAFFIALCLWPAWFAPLAYVFAALCALTMAARLALAARVFRD
ncbi:CDP-alcohol phosphatidyltransferase family protein [Roseibaca sp. Y0-43]|uniref:CDP-alcohol phosphatidyltransferase family protein n=1 Tax=Roseibaca sp. Y0-43 TaxID=2816854 RepID=UPI001D0C6993|nr:CDP-alcohol phosphatidyltransferase family protein [Roseibaca sp. Y0-43]MCC1480405.1 CDP-alcohol phosphatidyltransferase family protein [Roseibaca sp. Y0-43]